jgi:hypothetical protein
VRTAFHVDFAVQQAAFFVPGDGHVTVAMRADGELREQGVAVVAMRIHRVASVGRMRPQRIGQELVLRRLRPRRVALRMQRVLAHHFLQEHQVRGDAAHGLAQIMQHEPAIEQVEPHVAVEREDVERRHAGILRAPA